MNGILNILKPPGMTSFDVVGYLRGVTKIRKIGHTGTLDPAATGVLPICIGNATKVIEFLMEKDKLYRAEMTLGADTDTQDSTGQIIASKEVRATEAEIRSVIQSFVGKIRQVPPMYSAVKQDGKKLYELARQGITVERKPRDIEIYSITVLNAGSLPKVLLDVHCSKGTYIRTLCADIGQKLGCGGHMSFLVRTRTDIFELADSLTLEQVVQLSKDNRLAEKLIPVKDIFKKHKSVVLNNNDTKKLLNGVTVHIPDYLPETGAIVPVYTEEGAFISISEAAFDGNKTWIKSKKLFL